MATEGLTYTEALDELERILERLEHDEPDVDRVANDVARAAELVAYCRERIATARLRVEEVVSTLGRADEVEGDSTVEESDAGR